MATDLTSELAGASIGGHVNPSCRLGANRLTLFLVLCVPVLLTVAASPAAAHGNSGNYVTSVTSVRPAVLGLRVSAAPDGSFLTISNRTGRPVIVVGYEHEQYLKITANGVWQNALSPTTYRNDSGTKDGIPDPAEVQTAPVWQQISDSNTHSYHDHRIDWMEKRRPEVVAQDVNKPHLIKSWTIDLLVDDEPVTVNGTLSWSPSGFGAADVAFVLVCSAALGLVCFVAVRESRRKPDPWDLSTTGA